MSRQACACPLGAIAFPRHRRTARHDQLGRPSSLLCRAIGTPVGAIWNEEDYVLIGVIGPAHGVTGEVRVRVETSSPEARFGQPGTRYIQAPRSEGLVQTATEPPREVTLLHGREHIVKGHSVWLLRMEGCTDRNTAEELRNYRMYVHVNDREEVDNDDEFYAESLLGLSVFLEEPGTSRDDVMIGKVTEVCEGFGTYDSLRIKFAAGLVLNENGDLVTLQEYEASRSESEDEVSDSGSLKQGPRRFVRSQNYGLLPFNREFVPHVDIENGELVVTPPAGWLDLYLEPKEVAPAREPRKTRLKGRRLEKRRAKEKEAQALATALPGADIDTYSDSNA